MDNIVLVSLEEAQELARQKWAKVEEPGLGRNRCRACRVKWQKEGSDPEKRPPDLPPDPGCKDPCPVCGGPLYYSSCPF